MNKEKTLKLIKEAFGHFIIEEDIEIDGVPVHLYIPTLKTIITSKEINTDCYLEIIIKEEENNAGKIINDILLDREFVPMFEAE